MDHIEAVARVKEYAELYGGRAAGRIFKINRTTVARLMTGKYKFSGKRLTAKVAA